MIPFKAPQCYTLGNLRLDIYAIWDNHPGNRFEFVPWIITALQNEFMCAVDHTFLMPSEITRGKLGISFLWCGVLEKICRLPKIPDTAVIHSGYGLFCVIYRHNHHINTTQRVFRAIINFTIYVSNKHLQRKSKPLCNKRTTLSGSCIDVLHVCFIAVMNDVCLKRGKSSLQLLYEIFFIGWVYENISDSSSITIIVHSNNALYDWHLVAFFIVKYKPDFTHVLYQDPKWMEMFKKWCMSHS